MSRQTSGQQDETALPKTPAKRHRGGGEGVKRVTLREVAAEAGVSICTASKILSGRTGGVTFTRPTRQRVLEAAKRLAFTPSMVGRALVGGRSMTVGIITKGLTMPTTAQRVRSFIELAQQRGLSTMVASINQRGDDSRSVLEHAKAHLARGVDGLVIDRSMPLNAQVRRAIDALPLPVVYLGWGPARSTHRVVFERETAFDQMACHLASLGHRQVAYFSSHGQMDFPEHKLKPMERAFARHGLRIHCDMRWLVHEESMPVMEAADLAVKQFLQSGVHATALMMNNDESAMAAITTLRQAGLRVPQDMSIVGFDDLAFARHCQPSLATVALADLPDASDAALRMLCQLIEDPAAPVEKQVISHVYVPRESVAQARADSSRHLTSASCPGSHP